VAKIVGSEIDLWAKIVESTLFTTEGDMLVYRLIRN